MVQLIVFCDIPLSCPAGHCRRAKQQEEWEARQEERKARQAEMAGEPFDKEVSLLLYNTYDSNSILHTLQGVLMSCSYAASLVSYRSQLLAITRHACSGHSHWQSQACTLAEVLKHCSFGVVRSSASSIMHISNTCVCLPLRLAGSFA